MKKFILGMMLVAGMSLSAKDYSEYKSHVLISAREAKDILAADRNAVVLDIRPSFKYMAGHIPGSFSIWSPDIESKDKIYGQRGGKTATREELAKELSRVGVKEDTTIIVSGEVDALRLWWLLDLYGHEKIKVLDGGYNAWKNSGFESDIHPSRLPNPTDYKFNAPLDKGSIADLAEVKLALENPDYIILDTREAGGDEGRIPTDYFMAWKKTLNPDGTFKSAKELKTMFEAEGITPEKNVINYSETGIRSAHTTFVLRELLGYEEAKNYDGSWLEYSYEALQQNLPVEKGTPTGKHKEFRK